jgi:quercetin 2,3-dioxygenase
MHSHIIKGNAIFTKTGNNTIKEGHLVIFENDGNEVYFHAGTESKEPLELLLIGGKPLRELVVRYGPFVMNTQQEIFQAIEDYRNGKIG